MLLLVAAAAPWLATHSHPVTALAIAAFFGKLCHQNSGRSFVWFGAPVAVCVRCMGIYAGVALGGMLRLARAQAMRLFGFAMLLNCLDVLIQSIAIDADKPLARLMCGMLLGAGVGALLVAREGVRAENKE